MTQSAHKLVVSRRAERIMQLLREQGVMTVESLSQALGVSMATVRRDLQEMHDRGLLVRIHGGAALKDKINAEPLFSDKEGQHRPEKESIARAALELIEDQDTIFLDGGSTLLLLARLLDKRKQLTIVTNSLMAASLLMESGHRLILTGGEFRAISRTLVGPLTSSILHNLSVDKAFMGTMGFTAKDGMSTTDANEAFTKSLVMQRAAKVILLADHSKLGVRSLAACPSPRLDVLVTDWMEPDLRRELEENNTRVIECSIGK